MRRLAEAEQKGGMLALEIPAGVAEELAALGENLAAPQPVGQMHCTLVFFPDVEALGPEGMERVERIAAEVAREHLPLRANIVGAGSFATLNEESGGYPYVALLNAAGLNLLQADLVRALVAEGFPVSQQYGYIPHVTLGYGPGDAPVPPSSELPKDEWAVEDIHAYWEWGNGHPIRMVADAGESGRIVGDEDEDDERGAHRRAKTPGRKPEDGVKQAWPMMISSKEGRVRNLRGINEELDGLRSRLSEQSSDTQDVFMDPSVEEEFGAALALAVAKLIQGGQLDPDIVDDPSKLAKEVQKVLTDLRSHRGLITAAMRRLRRRGPGREIALVRRELGRI